MRIEGKHCVVTGASSGIGRAVAEALAAEGGRVVGLARRFDLEEVQIPSVGAITSVRADVSDEARIDEVFAALPATDVLVCCAGLGAFAPLAEASLADLRTLLDGHVVGTFLTCRAALRKMIPAAGGHIVAIGSTAVRNAFTGASGYTAAKSAQMAMCRVLREEVREHGIRVTELNPGATDTPIWDGSTGFDRSRMMQPSDVAGVLVDLVSRPGVCAEDVLLLPPGGNL